MTLNRVLAGGANARWPCECGCAERVPRYPTDLTDEQWAVLEPVLPVMLCDTELGGLPERHWRRTMIDAMFYVVDNGAKWRALPADFPPWQTVYGMHARWKQDGVLADITDLLRAAVRTAEGRPSRRPRSSTRSRSMSPPRRRPDRDQRLRSLQEGQRRKRHLLPTPAACSSRSSSPRPAPPTVTSPLLVLRQARRRGRRHHLGLADNGYHGDWLAWRTTSPASPPRSSSALAWPGSRLQDPAPPLGHRTHQRLDQPPPALRPRLREASRPPRRDGPLAAILQMTRRLARSITPAPTTL